MYKPGDKFEIEIAEVLENADTHLYRIKGFNALVFDKFGLDKLKRIEKPRLLKELRVGDEVLIAPNNKKGVVVECHVPDICGEDKYAVFAMTEIAYCLRSWLTRTGKHYESFTAFVREMGVDNA